MDLGVCLAGGEVKGAAHVVCNGELICFTSCNFRNEYSDNIIFVNNMKIGKAVRASCSYPVVFSPCK